MKFSSFKDIPVEKIEAFFKKHFTQSDGYSVNSVVFDNDEDRFVVKCTGKDNETYKDYEFALFALNPRCSAVADEDFYPIAWQCDEDFWTGDDVQDEYPNFIKSLVRN